jgi:uncharacterized membrane protein (DUF485 family)
MQVIPDARPGQDWETVAQSAAFGELVRRRRRFVLPVTLAATVWWGTFLLLVGYAHDFMGRSIYDEFTVAYALGLSQFLMVWAIVWAYLRAADTRFEPLEERVVYEAVVDRRLP